MTRKEVSLEHLRQLQRSLANTLISALDDDEKEFLVSLKRGKPEWGRMRIEHLSRFPAIQWKLINIRKMGSAKQKAALDKLFKVLST